MDVEANAARDGSTFPRLLIRNARIGGDRPAYREKELGIWLTWTWHEVLDEVRAIAWGLAAEGLARGDKLAIIGDNRPHLYWSMVAAQCLGAIPVPLYQDAVAEEMTFVLDHAEARFAVVEDQEQVDKLLEIRDRCPKLEKIIHKDTRGLRHYDAHNLMSLAALQDSGRDFAAQHPDYLDAEIDKGRHEDLAIILYTSGTTGQPKGVMLSFGNLITTAQNAVDFERLTEKDEVLAYLPMAWVGDNIFSLAQAYCAGFCISCPESTETVLTDMRELGPTYFFAPPRIWENLLTQVTIRMEDAAWIKRILFAYFMKLSRRVGGDILDRKHVPVHLRALYALGRILVFGPLMNTLGMTRIRIAYTAGEAIGSDIFDFYRSLGLNVKQLYGMTEAAVFITIQPDGDVRSDTVGPPARGVDLKIGDDGEVMFKSPGAFQGYYKNPEATAEATTADGYILTGDAGILGADGHLKIVDRAKDVGKLTDGTLFAPKFIENKLKFFPNIKEAVVFGDDRDNVVAFINIELEALGNWAERRGMAYSGYQDLAGKDEVNDLIGDHIEQVNRDLAADPQLAGSQISRYLVLHKELDADDGELTRTRKVRRRVIADRYGDLVDALYSDRDTVAVEAKVTFEDGRDGLIRANLSIKDARRFDHTEATVR